MFIGSEKEYELLKSEVDTIKKSILQFIGFILSIAGIAVAIGKIFLNPGDGKDNNVIMLGAIVAGLVATTLLFEIIWYKFKSHNRLVGYIQLLTQEIGFVNLTEDIKKKESTHDKSYLDNVKIGENTDIYSQKLFTWEYMMMRLNNADFDDSKERILESIQKAHFKFSIPVSKEYKNIRIDLRDHLAQDFFKNVVKVLYKPNKKLGRMLIDKIHDAFWGL